MRPSQSLMPWALFVLCGLFYQSLSLPTLSVVEEVKAVMKDAKCDDQLGNGGKMIEDTLQDHGSTHPSSATHMENVGLGKQVRESTQVPNEHQTKTRGSQPEIPSRKKDNAKLVAKEEETPKETIWQKIWHTLSWPGRIIKRCWDWIRRKTRRQAPEDVQANKGVIELSGGTKIRKELGSQGKGLVPEGSNSGETHGSISGGPGPSEILGPDENLPKTSKQLSKPLKSALKSSRPPATKNNVVKTENLFETSAALEKEKEIQQTAPVVTEIPTATDEDNKIRQKEPVSPVTSAPEEEAETSQGVPTFRENTIDQATDGTASQSPEHQTPTFKRTPSNSNQVTDVQDSRVLSEISSINPNSRESLSLNIPKATTEKTKESSNNKLVVYPASNPDGSLALTIPTDIPNTRESSRNMVAVHPETKKLQQRHEAKQKACAEFSTSQKYPTKNQALTCTVIDDELPKPICNVQFEQTITPDGTDGSYTAETKLATQIVKITKDHETGQVTTQFHSTVNKVISMKRSRIYNSGQHSPSLEHNEGDFKYLEAAPGSKHELR
ncbi:hypothetical protein CROQUDRAFT_106687 [Cronartium quercuum f. sp. fusiforme G11]|uniref:Uncharacterized protein n=1 Tax=Cronartium quercuum f. sp. fusiforme G11 TaxID=708437 RepID=A0A9P6TC87_9BASI|nr:hypothetical protein CROQUDRAFT_106687 [Cronartium quercuum f. sp. fusiforme G11]